jgi:hypothetical protein
MLNNTQSTCMFVSVQTHANTRQSTCLLPVCFSMRKQTQTHANTHPREVACCLYAYPCSKTRRALAFSSIFKHTQTHARALASCLCVYPCSNTRKHTPEHLLVACVFVHAQTHANTQQSTCMYAEGA